MCKNYQFILSLIFGVMFVCGFAVAQETHLQCRGKKTYLGEKPTEAIYEVSFDANKKVVISMTQGIAQGCFQDDISQSSGCDCKVTKETISCFSSAVGLKNLSHKVLSSFTINRFSGRMQTQRTDSGTDVTTGKDYFYSVSGELTCEKLTASKF